MVWPFFMYLLNPESEIIPGIAARSHHVFPDIPEKSQDHVNDDRGAHGEHRCIHKILPDLAGSDPQAVANGRTNTKGVPFDKVFESVHRANIEKIKQLPQTGVIKMTCFSYFCGTFSISQLADLPISRFDLPSITSLKSANCTNTPVADV